MPLQIVIHDDEIKYLNSPATDELSSSIKKFADDLIQEASRLEASGNSTGGLPEITSSMVVDASILLRRGYRKPKKNGWLTFSQILSPIAFLITGLLADFQKLEDAKTMVIFIFVLTIAITSTVIVLLKEQ